MLLRFENLIAEKLLELFQLSISSSGNSEAEVQIKRKAIEIETLYDALLDIATEEN